MKIALEPVIDITECNPCYILPYRRTKVTLKKSGVVLDLVPQVTKVNNLIFGRTWVDSPGELVMTNLTTGDKVVLYFQPCGWFGYDIGRQFLIASVI